MQGYAQHAAFADGGLVHLREIGINRVIPLVFVEQVVAAHGERELIPQPRLAQAEAQLEVVAAGEAGVLIVTG